MHALFIRTVTLSYMYMNLYIPVLIAKKFIILICGSLRIYIRLIDLSILQLRGMHGHVIVQIIKKKNLPLFIKRGPPLIESTASRRHF